MFLIEWPWRHNDSEGKGRSKQTESKRKFDVLFEEANEEGNGLLLLVSTFGMIRYGLNHLLQISPIKMSLGIRPIFVLQSPTGGTWN